MKNPYGFTSTDMTSNGSALRFSSRCTVGAAQRISPALMTVSADLPSLVTARTLASVRKNDQSIKRVFVHGNDRASRNPCAHDTHLRIVDYHLVVAGRNLGGIER